MRNPAKCQILPQNRTPFFDLKPHNGEKLPLVVIVTSLNVCRPVIANCVCCDRMELNAAAINMCMSTEYNISLHAKNPFNVV